MRQGNHPLKDKINQQSNYIHQVIVPVYIPNFEGYFKDSFKIFKICLSSIITTSHSKTFITVVNNGSDKIIEDYLNQLLTDSKIHEIIHTENIGKVNSILKGVSGTNIPLVTISDADVLFCNAWQKETLKVFNTFPKTGAVGLIPQFGTFKTFCGNILFDTFFSKKVKFTKVKSKEGLINFYKSIGWKNDYNKNYLEMNLTVSKDNVSAIIGSGHVVATYKKEVFKTIETYIPYKMGGSSEAYLDNTPLKYGLWRLTTDDNLAFHLGNTFEDWMNEKYNELETPDFNFNYFELNNKSNKLKRVSKLIYFVKNKLFLKLFKLKFIYKWFLKSKDLPKEMLDNY